MKKAITLNVSILKEAMMTSDSPDVVMLPANTVELMKHVASVFKIELTLNCPNAPPNSSWSAGFDCIGIGLYENTEFELVSFFHELGHCLLARDGTPNLDSMPLSHWKIEQEAQAWAVGFAMADCYSIKFSAKARAWARKQLRTYLGCEGGGTTTFPKRYYRIFREK